MLSGLLHDSLPHFAFANPKTGATSWPTLLVVDSDQEMAQRLVCFFEKRGFHVAAGGSLAEAKDVFHRRKSWTLVIADFHLPDGTGWDLHSWVEEQSTNTPVLLMSGSPHCATLCAGSDYLSKPFAMEKIEAYVRKLPRRI